MQETSEDNEQSAATSASLEDVWFKLICFQFEEEYGHGWKRTLAKAAGVPDSTVHSWIKVGRGPSWLQRFFELLIQTSRLRRNERLVAKQVRDYQQVGQVVEDGDGFAVYRSEEGIGKLVARGIPNLESAREIAALPRLKSMSDQLADALAGIIDIEALGEDWFTDEQKGVVAEVRDWSSPPTLSVEKVGKKIEDLGKALTILTKEFGADTE